MNENIQLDMPSLCIFTKNHDTHAGNHMSETMVGTSAWIVLLNRSWDGYKPVFCVFYPQFVLDWQINQDL